MTPLAPEQRQRSHYAKPLWLFLLLQKGSTMSIGIFYCNQIPMYDLAEIDWLIQNPIREKELENELGEDVWKVEYDSSHPNMQIYNRDETCLVWGFLGAVFEDEARLDDRCAIFPGQGIKVNRVIA